MAVNARTDPNSATASNLQALQAFLLRVDDFWRDMIQNLPIPTRSIHAALLGAEPS